jgi:hypothetical protein
MLFQELLNLQPIAKLARIGIGPAEQDDLFAVGTTDIEAV